MDLYKIIDGKAIATQITNFTTTYLNKLSVNAKSRKLVILMISDDQPSTTWIALKQKRAQELGITSELIKFDASVDIEQVLAQIQKLNSDTQVAGILVQLPLFPHLESYRYQILAAVKPSKDIDGLTPLNQGELNFGHEQFVSATALAVMESLNYIDDPQNYIYNKQIDLAGKHAVIINHSVLIGRPLSQLLLNRNATVTICHEYTKDLAALTKQADILVTATGQVGLITAAHIKDKSILVDVTSIKTAAGFRGDIDFSPELMSKAAAWTPVPGGVGPVTIACLMANMAKALENN